MTDTPIIARAGNPPKPKKVSPWRVVQQAFAAHRERLDSLFAKVDRVERARDSNTERVAKLESMLRATATSKPPATTAKMQNVIAVGAIEISKKGQVARRIRFGGVTMLVPCLDTAEDAELPEIEFTLQAPIEIEPESSDK